MNLDEVGFEDALGRLEEIVEALEGGSLSLDEALARYETGVRLVTRCQGLLTGAERKVALVLGVATDGTPQTTPFDTPKNDSPAED